MKKIIIIALLLFLTSCTTNKQCIDTKIEKTENGMSKQQVIEAFGYPSSIINCVTCEEWVYERTSVNTVVRFGYGKTVISCVHHLPKF